MTANFKYEGTENMEKLLEYQPNRPILVSEFWPGWFDHWFEPIHNILNLEEFEQILLNIFNYKGTIHNQRLLWGEGKGAFKNGNDKRNYHALEELRIKSSDSKFSNRLFSAKNCKILNQYL